MADDNSHRLLPDGKTYHFNVIYNHAKSPMSITPDNELALNFTEKVVATLHSLGFIKSYYHELDCLPGRNIFKELFRVVQGSDYTILILTPGFVQDCWARYRQMATFNTLLQDGLTHKFIPISVGVNTSCIPQELNTEHVLFFQEDWSRDRNAWRKLQRVFDENIPVPEVNRYADVNINEPIEETDRQEDTLGDVFDGAASESNVPRIRSGVEHSVGGPQVVQNIGSNNTLFVGVSNTRGGLRPSSGFCPSGDEVWMMSQGQGSRGSPIAGDVLDAHANTQTSVHPEMLAELAQGPTITNPSVNLRQTTQSYEESIPLHQRNLNLESLDVSSGRTNVREVGSGSLPEGDLDADAGDIENSVVNRLERTGMVSFRQELFETRRKSIGEGAQQTVSGLDWTRRKSLLDRPSGKNSVGDASNQTYPKTIVERCPRDNRTTKSIEEGVDQTNNNDADVKFEPIFKPLNQSTNDGIVQPRFSKLNSQHEIQQTTPDTAPSGAGLGDHLTAQTQRTYDEHKSSYPMEESTRAIPQQAESGGFSLTSRLFLVKICFHLWSRAEDPFYV